MRITGALRINANYLSTQLYNSEKERKKRNAITKNKKKEKRILLAVHNMFYGEDGEEKGDGVRLDHGWSTRVASSTFNNARNAGLSFRIA